MTENTLVLFPAVFSPALSKCRVRTYIKKTPIQTFRVWLRTVSKVQGTLSSMMARDRDKQQMLTSILNRNQTHRTVPSLFNSAPSSSSPGRSSRFSTPQATNVRSACSYSPTFTITSGLDFCIMIRFAIIFY